MRDVEIEAAARSVHQDLIDSLELPMENPCSIHLHQKWISKEAEKPEGFCTSAWNSLYPYVFALAAGADTLFDDWMKEKGTALVSCSDGFRPVSFLLKAKNPDDCRQ